MDPSSHLQVVPAERLFWARLDPLTIGARGTRSASDRRRMGYAFERFLPCPIERVHAVYVREGDTILACGIHLEELHSLLERGAIRLRPDLVPAWLESGIDPEDLNLATFEATPPQIRAARQQLATTLSIAACLILGLTAFGLHRRAAELDSKASELRHASDAMIVERLGPSLSGQLPRLRLTAELRRLRALDSSSESYAGAADAVTTLEAALTAWPSGVLAQTESLTATGSTMRLRILHESTASADAFASAWKPDPKRWTARQPSMTTQRDQVRLELVCEHGGGR